MGYALMVRAIESVGNLHGISERLIQRERALFQTGGQGLAFEKLQDQEVYAILTPDILKRADIGVIETGDGVSFALEALSDLRLVSEMRRQDFDRDSTIQAGIARTVYFSHSSGAERRQDLVRSETSSGSEGHLGLIMPYVGTDFRLANCSEKEIATARFPLWSGLGVVFRIVDDHAASNHDTLPRNDSCFTVTLAGTGGIEKKGLKLSWRRVNRGATVQFQRYQLRRVYVDLFRS